MEPQAVQLLVLVLEAVLLRQKAYLGQLPTALVVELQYGGAAANGLPSKAVIHRIKLPQRPERRRVGVALGMGID